MKNQFVSYIVIHGAPPSPQAAKALVSATCFFTARESAEKVQNLQFTETNCGSSPSYKLTNFINLEPSPLAEKVDCREIYCYYQVRT